MSFRTGFVRLALLACAAVGLAACDRSPSPAPTAPAPVAQLSSLALAVSSKTLAVGGTITLNVTGTYSNGTSAAVTATFTSSDSSVATVTSAGVVSAVGPGSATISVTSGSQSVFFVVTVDSSAPTLETLSLSTTTLSELVGGTGVIVVTGNYSDGSSANISAEVSYSSSAPDVAEVTGGGQVLGIAPGTATITISSSGHSATVAVTVTAASLTGISATPGAPVLALGATVSLTVTGLYSNGTTTPLTSKATFTSANTGVATVTAGGVVTGAGNGATTITVSAGGLTTTVSVTVQGPTLVSLSVSPTSVTEIAALSTPLQVTGHYSDSSTQNLTATVSYLSANTSVATVSAAGVVLGVSAGTTQVQVSYQSVTATPVPVTITAPVLTSISVSPASKTLAVAGTVALTVTGTYNNGVQAPVTSSSTFGSSATGIATVSAAGVVTAVAAGNATITASNATSGTTLTATMAVTVSSSAPTLTSLTITPTAITAYVGVSAPTQLTVTGHYSDGSSQNLTSQVSYGTSSAGVATVSAAGLVTATGAGGATITASSSGVSASIPVTVPALASIAVAPGSPTLGVGGTVQLAVTATFSDSTTATVTASSSYSSSVTSVATVSAAGLVTAVGSGSSTITATYSGKTSTSSVTVACCSGSSAYELFASTFTVPATIVPGGPSGTSVQGGDFYVYYSPYYAYGCAASAASKAGSPADDGYYFVQAVAQETYCGTYSGSGGSFGSTDYFEIAFNGPTVNSSIQPLTISQSTNLLVRMGNVTAVSSLNGTGGIFTVEMSNTNGATVGTDICDANVTLLAHGQNTSASQSGLLDYQVPFSSFTCSSGSVAHLQTTGVYQVVVKLLAANNPNIKVNSFDSIAVTLIAFDTPPTASPGLTAPSGWSLYSDSYTLPPTPPQDSHVAISAQGGEVFAFYNGNYAYGGAGSPAAGQAALTAAGFFYLQFKETAAPTSADSVGLSFLAPQPTPGTPTPVDVSQAGHMLVRMGNTQPTAGANGNALVYTVEMSDPIGAAAAADVCDANVTLGGAGPGGIGPTYYSVYGLNDYWVPFSSFTCASGTLAHLQATGVYATAVKIIPTAAGNSKVVSGSLDEMAVQFIGFTE